MTDQDPEVNTDEPEVDAEEQQPEGEEPTEGEDEIEKEPALPVDDEWSDVDDIDEPAVDGLNDHGTHNAAMAGRQTSPGYDPSKL